MTCCTGVAIARAVYPGKGEVGLAERIECKPSRQSGATPPKVQR